MERIISTTTPERLVTVNVRQSVKDELERIQEEIKRSEKLSARPPMSDVVDILIRAFPPINAAP